MKVTILAIGKMRDNAQLTLAQDYAKRIKGELVIKELTAKQPHDEPAELRKHIPEDAVVIALDERGKALSSKEFAGKIEAYQSAGKAHLCFIIGGSEGLDDATRKRADLLLSFGAMTWPHMLARILLLEQLYRAQSILDGHPYHK